MDGPGASAGWLVTTTRREAMRTLQRTVREVVTDDVPATGQTESAPPETIAIERERRTAVHDAVARLPARRRHLMALLLTTHTPSYWHVAEHTDVPIGSIGPRRDRALARLRTDRQLAHAVQP